MTENHSKHWKEFAHNPLTHSGGHYLMAIKQLRLERGYARMTDVAKHLDVKPSTCFAGVLSLIKKGFVKEDKNKFLFLTKSGTHYEALLEKNDLIFEKLFRDFLGISKEQAEKDACKIEHLISEETSARLCMFLKFLESKDICIKQFLQQFTEFTIDPNDQKCSCCLYKKHCLLKNAQDNSDPGGQSSQ